APLHRVRYQLRFGAGGGDRASHPAEQQPGLGAGGSVSAQSARRRSTGGDIGWRNLSPLSNGRPLRRGSGLRGADRRRLAGRRQLPMLRLYFVVHARRSAKGQPVKRKAVVLLSGGLDSATCLGIAQRQGFEATCLCIDYGQRHAVEVERARRVAQASGSPLRLVRLDLRAIGGSSLTDDIPVPKGRSSAEMASGIPPTYVPARNTVFLALALGLAEA